MNFIRITGRYQAKNREEGLAPLRWAAGLKPTLWGSYIKSLRRPLLVWLKIWLH